MAAIPVALTTTFTPAPSCLTDIHWASQSAWYVLGEYNTNCMPHTSNSALPNPTLSSFYSPALYCPSGFTVACSSEVGSETRAVCCPQPTDIPILSRNSFTCYSSPPAWGAWSSYGCAMGMGTMVSDGPITIVVTDGTGTRTTSTSLTNVNEGLNAYSVQIRWHASDLALATATSSSSAPSNTASTGSAVASAVSSTTARSTTENAAPSSSADVISTSSQSASSTGLSTGAIIAIGVIIPVVVIIALAAGFFLWRRKKQARSGPRSLHSPPHTPGPPPLTPVQAMSIPKYEMEVKSQYPQEMDDTSVKFEKSRFHA